MFESDAHPSSRGQPSLDRAGDDVDHHLGLGDLDVVEHRVFQPGAGGRRRGMRHQEQVPGPVDPQSNRRYHRTMGRNAEVDQWGSKVEDPVQPQGRGVAQRSAASRIQERREHPRRVRNHAGVGEIHAGENDLPSTVGQIPARLVTGEAQREQLLAADDARLRVGEVPPSVGSFGHRPSLSSFGRQRPRACGQPAR